MLNIFTYFIQEVEIAVLARLKKKKFIHAKREKLQRPNFLFYWDKESVRKESVTIKQIKILPLVGFMNKITVNKELTWCKLTVYMYKTSSYLKVEREEYDKKQQSQALNQTLMMVW